jgi:hypothetical protein
MGILDGIMAARPDGLAQASGNAAVGKAAWGPPMSLSGEMVTDWHWITQIASPK